MIVDLHTHLGEYPRHIDERFVAEAQAAWGAGLRLGRTPDEHYEETRGADRVVALGFCAPFSGWTVPNDYVAEYVARDPERLVGFGSVDPNAADAPDELERMKHDLGLRGCKLAPIYQDVDPLGPGFLRVCETLERLELPMLVHQGTTFVRRGPLAHALLCAVEYRAERKLLFGSDYPFFTAEETIAGLRAVNDVVAATGMPRIAERTVEEIVHRPTLELLGIA